jgi:WD40 repeat protein
VRVGRYEVLDELGRGGVGVVYRARGPDGADVALKLLLRPDSPERIARFRREAELQAALSRAEGFVPLLDSGATPDGKPWLVCPFLPGGTLRARLEDGPLPIDEVVALGRALASAMARAHARGLVHRDLKPENVLFDENRRPLVADLGLAKLVDGASLGLSLSGQARGTLGYMPAEQARDAKHVAPAADVFALGAIIYECLAGRPAFSGESALELLVRLEEGNFEPLAPHRPDAPRWLVRVVERCLDKNSAARPRDGAELVRALEARESSRARWPLLVVPGVLAFVVSAAAVAWLARPSPGSPAAPGPAPSASTPAPKAAPSAWPFEPDPDPVAPRSGFFEWKLARPPAVLGSFAWSHSESVDRMALSADGRLALTGAEDGGVKVWDVSSGRALRSFRFPFHIAAVAFTSDPRSVLAAGAGTGEVLLLDLVHRGESRVPVGSDVLSIAALDGGRALVGCRDGLIRSVDLTTKTVSGSLDTRAGAIHCLDLSRDGSLVAAGGDGSVVLLSTSPLAVVRTLPAPGTSVIGVILDGRGRAIAACDDGKIRLWGARTGKALAALPAAAPQHAVAAAPDGRHLVSAGKDGAILLWDLESQAARRLGAHRGSVGGVAISPDGRVVFSCGEDRVVKLWDVEKGGAIGEPPGHRGAVMSVAVTPSGRSILSGGEDGTVRVWDRETRACVRTLRGHVGRVECVAVSPDGAFIASAAEDATVRVWDGATGQELSVLRGHQSLAMGVAFVPSGLLSCGMDRTLRLWNPTTGALLRTYPLGTSMAGRMAVSQDGRVAYMGDQDDRTVACDLETGALRDLYQANANRNVSNVLALALDPAGRLVFSGGIAASLHVWEVGSGAASSLPHGCWVFAVASVPGTRKIVTSAYDERLHVWDLSDPSRPEDEALLPNDHARSLAATPTSLVAGTARGVVLDFAFEKR